ncbi:hypothetical protein EDB81DRAFT_604830, partial [Dactylonectria macrodidyma]
HGWGRVVINPPFIALLIGIYFAAKINVHNNKYHQRRLKKNGFKAVPEARLPTMTIGGVAFTDGLFLFACELISSKHLNYWPSIIDIALTGLGFTAIFQSAVNYLIDTFRRFSASAVATNTSFGTRFYG